jgi:hypothetical protein
MERRSIDDLEVTPCPLASEFQEPVSLCRVCGREVLDLSQFTREEAARILSKTVPPCVRFALRDGKPLFRNAVVAAGAAAFLTATATLVTLRSREAAPLPVPVQLGGAPLPNVEWRPDPKPGD